MHPRPHGPPPVRAAIALGANLGDRAASIARALSAIGALPGTRLIASSSLIQTRAVTGAAAETQPDYLNAAALVDTTLSARDLLVALLGIERALGRDRSRADQWAARTIDLDLLLYAGAVIDEPGLTVPHPRMHERLFVLRPLAEIAPDAVHPVLRRTVRELLSRLVGGRDSAD